MRHSETRMTRHKYRQGLNHTDQQGVPLKTKSARVPASLLLSRATLSQEGRVRGATPFGISGCSHPLGPTESIAHIKKREPRYRTWALH